MANNQQLKEGADFTEMTAGLSKSIKQLRDATFRATKEDLPVDDAKALLRRAQEQIAEFETLLGRYDGGRRDSIVTAGSQINALKRNTAALQEKLAGK